ncbi:DUF2510 domain-containing protein [Cellulomonas sp. ICMP 17802]|uniref:DUF2510 domain-containing protein n=1 Tax=Cellulomonas sp. ICMP 17802 TaxID=3239199 RepID=UPI00351BC0BD
METPPPNWYPDPRADGRLRWWDGARWTEHVQPALVAGKPVLGQEVTEGGLHATFYGPGEPITHAYPPVTDARYADSPLAHALAAEVRAGRSGGDVQIPAEHAAAVEAVHQLRARGGVLGALAGVGEQLLAESIAGSVPAPRPSPVWTPSAPGPQDAVPQPASTPTAWMAGATTPAAPAGYRAAGTAVRGALGVLALWRLLTFFGAGALFLVVGLVLAVAGPGPAGSLGWALAGMGALTVGAGVWSLVASRRGRGGEWGPLQ